VKIEERGGRGRGGDKRERKISDGANKLCRKTFLKHRERETSLAK